MLLDFEKDPKIYSDIMTRYLGSLMSEVSEIRTNTSRLVLASSAGQLAVGGWAVSHDIQSIDKIYFMMGLLVFCIVSFVLVFKQESYFNEAAIAINRIDKKLGAFTPGFYLEDEKLLPSKWEKFGTPDWNEPIFYFGRYLLLGSCLVGGVLVWHA